MRTQPLPNEENLMTQLFSFRDDPLAFVLYAFPWGQKGTPLEYHKGPRQWQLKALRLIKTQLAENRRLLSLGETPKLIKLARSSGRGIGKSAMMGWLSLWTFSTNPASTVLVSANTESQLKGTTFPEIRKWATMAINSHWFEHHAMSLKPQSWLSDALKKQGMGLDDAYWYIQARLWSEENPDGFAGPHSQVGMTVLFDEASGIPKCIWPVAQGYFTDKTIHRLWFAISNPRNPSGAFFDCFHKDRDEWDTENIDARSVTENDQSLYESIIRQYGIDSDEARVEVYGQFPRQGDTQFIGRGLVDDAVARTPTEDHGAPLVMGVDPARFGDDKAVIAFIQGRDGKSIDPIGIKRCSLTELAERVIEAINKYNPDHVNVEGDGVGGGLVDILKHLGYQVNEISSGGSPRNKERYANKRTEMWGELKLWLETGALPNIADLIDDLTAPEYKYSLQGQYQLEPKDQMKKRGFASPDYADAYAICFGRHVSRNDTKTSRTKRRRNRATGVDDFAFS